MKLITKKLIDIGVCDIFEENPKCRIKLDRVDIMLYGKGLKRYDVTKKKLQSSSEFLYFDHYNNCLFQ